MVHAGAVYSACITIPAETGRQCTWTTAVKASAAMASQIELASSIRAELHYEACRIIEYYRSGGRMPLEQLPGGRYVSRDA